MGRMSLVSSEFFPRWERRTEGWTMAQGCVFAKSGWEIAGIRGWTHLDVWHREQNAHRVLERSRLAWPGRFGVPGLQAAIGATRQDFASLTKLMGCIGPLCGLVLHHWSELSSMLRDEKKKRNFWERKIKEQDKLKKKKKGKGKKNQSHHGLEQLHWKLSQVFKKKSCWFAIVKAQNSNINIYTPLQVDTYKRKLNASPTHCCLLQGSALKSASLSSTETSMNTNRWPKRIRQGKVMFAVPVRNWGKMAESHAHFSKVFTSGDRDACRYLDTSHVQRCLTMLSSAPD